MLGPLGIFGMFGILPGWFPGKAGGDPPGKLGGMPPGKFGFPPGMAGLFGMLPPGKFGFPPGKLGGALPGKIGLPPGIAGLFGGFGVLGFPPGKFGPFPGTFGGILPGMFGNPPGIAGFGRGMFAGCPPGGWAFEKPAISPIASSGSNVATRIPARSQFRVVGMVIYPLPSEASLSLPNSQRRCKEKPNMPGVPLQCVRSSSCSGIRKDPGAI
jgi:hypothetical protein